MLWLLWPVLCSRAEKYAGEAEVNMSVGEWDAARCVGVSQVCIGVDSIPLVTIT